MASQSNKPASTPTKKNEKASPSAAKGPSNDTAQGQPEKATAQSPSSRSSSSASSRPREPSLIEAQAASDTPLELLEDGKTHASTGLDEAGADIVIEETKGDDERAEVQDVTSIYKAAKSWEELKLSPNLLKGVYAMGFKFPSKIQAQAIPMILSNKRPNIIAQAQHGSGKTATYTLGMLMLVDESKNVPQALCVCHTRELAIQVHNVVTTLAKYTNIKTFLAVQGSEKEQVTQQVVIGTAGSIFNKLRYKSVDGASIKVLVLDEADNFLCNPRNASEVQKVRKFLPGDTQILEFSATFPQNVRVFCQKFAPRALKITLKKEDLRLKNIQQYSFECRDETHKFQVLVEIYTLFEGGQVIIFVNSKKSADILAERLRKDGYAVSVTHGQIQFDERDKLMEDFRKGLTQVLITTNVLSRGIDVEQVKFVVNYEIPFCMHKDEDSTFKVPDPETYIHRIGRTGRFGKKGVAINLLHDEESCRFMEQISDYYKAPVTALSTDDLEAAVKTIKEFIPSASKS